MCPGSHALGTSHPRVSGALVAGHHTFGVCTPRAGPGETPVCIRIGVLFVVVESFLADRCSVQRGIAAPLSCGGRDVYSLFGADEGIGARTSHIKLVCKATVPHKGLKCRYGFGEKKISSPCPCLSLGAQNYSSDTHARLEAPQWPLGQQLMELSSAPGT